MALRTSTFRPVGSAAELPLLPIRLPCMRVVEVQKVQADDNSVLLCSRPSGTRIPADSSCAVLPPTAPLLFPLAGLPALLLVILLLWIHLFALD